MSEREPGMMDVISMHGHTIPLHQFHIHLLTWGKEHLRMFPWRTSDNSFHILIAKLMLRRTQAKQVVAVYHQFTIQYPDAETLARVPSTEIARLLHPLGLAWRVPAFQQIAHKLTAEYNGRVPEHYQTLLALPGVGDYVASAVCCFAFGQSIPVVDTNTVRVAGRLFGIVTHTESRRRQPIRHLMSNLLDYQEPRAYNYALLDLAAIVFTPFHPRCNRCPLRQYCVTEQLRNTEHG
jgi:A/G-specific adenine glycosylase